MRSALKPMIGAKRHPPTWEPQRLRTRPTLPQRSRHAMCPPMMPMSWYCGSHDTMQMDSTGWTRRVVCRRGERCRVGRGAAAAERAPPTPPPPSPPPHSPPPPSPPHPRRSHPHRRRPRRRRPHRLHPRCHPPRRHPRHRVGGAANVSAVVMGRRGCGSGLWQHLPHGEDVVDEVVGRDHHAYSHESPPAVEQLTPAPSAAECSPTLWVARRPGRELEKSDLVGRRLRRPSCSVPSLTTPRAVVCRRHRLAPLPQPALQPCRLRNEERRGHRILFCGAVVKALEAE